MIIGQSDKEFFIDVLKSIGAPVTKENLKFLAAWRQAEGGTASNNPFNTTYKLDSDSKKTDYNSVGVKNYSNRTYGLAATTKTLKLPYYKNIVKGLQNNIGASNIASNTSELKTWGTGEGVARVLNGGKIKPPTIGDGKNAKVYSGSAETDSEEVSPGELAAVEVEKSKKITPNWWEDDDEEVVVQEPVQQEQAYSNELPFYMSEIPVEDQILLYGEQMFDKGGIVKPAGDPWEYKKDGDKYLTRKRGSNSWITATGLPEESIKAKVFKEIPVSDRVKEATASYTREKRSQPKSETPRRKEAWRDVKGVERPKTDAEKRMDASLSQSQGDFSDVKTWQDLIDAGQMSEEEKETINQYRAVGYDIDLNKPLAEMPWEETQTSINIESGGMFVKDGMQVPADTPGAKYMSKKEIEFFVNNQKAGWYDKIVGNPLAGLVYGDDMERGQTVISEGILGMDRDDDSWTKTGIDIAEYIAPDVALYKLAPKVFAPLTAIQLFGMGVSTFADIGYDEDWKKKYGDQTGTQYIEKDIADTWQRTKNSYSDQQGKFKLDSRMKRDLGFAGDAIEDVGRGIQSGYNTVSKGLSNAWDWATDWKDGGVPNKEYKVLELTDKEAQQYRLGGYIVEEIK